MKKIFAYIATGLLFACATGLAQAEGYYNASENRYTDGLSDNHDSRKMQIIPTRVVLDQGSRYIEGMGFAPDDKGQETILSQSANHRDYTGEGLSDEELTNITQIREIEKIVPAAGE